MLPTVVYVLPSEYSGGFTRVRERGGGGVIANIYTGSNVGTDRLGSFFLGISTRRRQRSPQKCLLAVAGTHR